MVFLFIDEQLQRRLRTPGLKICATGGYAGWVLKGMAFDITIRSDLTLFGIGLVGTRNTR